MDKEKVLMDARTQKIIEEVYNMRALFDDIQYIFKSKNPNVEYLDYVEELLFIMDKLEVLITATRNEDVKKECKSLLKTIKQYKEKENILEYEIKNKVLMELIDLTSPNKRVGKFEILLGISNINGLLQIHKKDILAIRDDDLIFYSKLSMGINRDADISPLERLELGKNILASLLDFVLKSYEKSRLPFDFYEKVMIINILDEVKLTL